ncbi:MAG: response regulator [Desulfobacteraceae bacterium]|nr:response regulator [Desulfobacteraceae bacterium]
MAEKDLLEGKRILIVDDEHDILDTLEDLLPMCIVSKASSFDEAKNLFENEYYDIAILDIMGVAGFKLLYIANKRKVMAVMLTAYALSPENIIKSYRNGAASYIPKDEIGNITNFLNDILVAKEKGRNTWERWFHRLGSIWRQKFGHDWQDKDKGFWEKFNASNRNNQ